jgi:tripartite motif-containing protein 71
LDNEPEGNMRKNIFRWICLFLAAGWLVACGAKTTATQSPTPLQTLTPAPVHTQTPAPIQTQSPTPTALPVEFSWKITGDPNLFNAPVGVAIDSQGDVYVMDVGNSRVQKFDSSGKFLMMWGSRGSADGQFLITLPDDGHLAVDSQGNVFVLDVSNYRVQKFDSNGKYLTQWGTQGDGEGQFIEAADIAIDKQDNLYVGDFKSNTVQKFDENGKFLLRWGTTGDSDGQFSGITSVAIDQEGNVLVNDDGGPLQKFDTNGKFLSKISLDPLNGHFIEFWNVAVDAKGNIYIADHNSFRIVELDSQGKNLATWDGGIAGAAAFKSLEDIAVDEQGNVYVTDSISNLVQKFQLPALRP